MILIHELNKLVEIRSPDSDSSSLQVLDTSDCLIPDDDYMTGTLCSLKHVNNLHTLVNLIDRIKKYHGNGVAFAIEKTIERHIRCRCMLNYYINASILIETHFLSHIITCELALRCPLRGKDDLLGMSESAHKHHQSNKKNIRFHRGMNLFQQQPVLVQFEMHDTLSIFDLLIQDITKSLKKTQT